MIEDFSVVSSLPRLVAPIVNLMLFLAICALVGVQVFIAAAVFLEGAVDTEDIGGTLDGLDCAGGRLD